MQEEVNQKTIALSVKTAKLTEDVLKKLIRAYLNYRKEHKTPQHGKTSVKKLMGENAGASSLEVTDGNIKSFAKVARKYNIDFAVKRDKTTNPPKYVVFFKGRDADAMTQAFKEYVAENERKQNRISVREKLAKFKDVVSKSMNRERTREKQKDKGRDR